MRYSKKDKEYYDLENKSLPHKSWIQLSSNQARKLCKAIAEKYDICLGKVSFRTWKEYFRKGYSEAIIGRDGLIITPNPFVPIVCHEMAHLYQWQKQGITDHNKKLLIVTETFVNFAIHWLGKIGCKGI